MSEEIPAGFEKQFSETEFLVEATGFESLTIWKEYHERVSWTQDSIGCLVTVGRVGERPCCISVGWNIIGGHRIAFWEPTSQAVDHAQIESWFDANCNPTHDGRKSRTNAMNFHIAIQGLGIKISEQVDHETLESSDAVIVLHAKTVDGKPMTREQAEELHRLVNERHKTPHGICPWCDEIYPLEGSSVREFAESHLQQCNNHPMRAVEQQLTAEKAEVKRLKQRLLTAAGDDLCRLTQEEIKDLTGGKVPIPPKGEFLASCERFHAQVAGEAGVNQNCLTLAQLIAENERLKQSLGAEESTRKQLEGLYEQAKAELAALRAPGDDVEELAKVYWDEVSHSVLEKWEHAGHYAKTLVIAGVGKVAARVRASRDAEVADLRRQIEQHEAFAKPLVEAKEKAERERDEKQRKLDRAHTRIGELDHELGKNDGHKLREELGKAREENGAAWDAVIENHPEAENANLTLAEAIADAIVSAHDDLAVEKSDKARAEREADALRTQLAEVERLPAIVRQIYSKLHPGGCKMLSRGSACDCFLCQMDNAIAGCSVTAPPVAEPDDHIADVGKMVPSGKTYKSVGEMLGDTTDAEFLGQCWDSHRETIRDLQRLVGAMVTGEGHTLGCKCGNAICAERERLMENALPPEFTKPIEPGAPTPDAKAEATCEQDRLAAIQAAVAAASDETPPTLEECLREADAHLQHAKEWLVLGTRGDEACWELAAKCRDAQADVRGLAKLQQAQETKQ